MAAVAVVGAAAAAAYARLRRRSGPSAEELSDPRAEELRRKLAEARGASADEDEFHAAGMGAETIVEEPPSGPTGTGAEERPPSAEFEEIRRRVHEEGRAAAEKMRESAEPPEP